MTPLPRSRVRELDDQATAFNAMLIGLRAFSTYIPRSLVAKLVRTGEIGIAEPREAIVTVMFTDIAGFTTLSEQMDAAAAAKLLNHHFAILCRAVDAHGGTVDKFLGDGMMAFFGAPDRLKGHAAAARARCCLHPRRAGERQSGARQGRPALRVRIGIHTGSVIVGNIGAADRVNYTIIGDTVNVSQRLQELGKLLAPGRRDLDHHFRRDSFAARRQVRNDVGRQAQAAWAWRGDGGLPAWRRRSGRSQCPGGLRAIPLTETGWPCASSCVPTMLGRPCRRLVKAGAAKGLANDDDDREPRVRKDMDGPVVR